MSERRVFLALGDSPVNIVGKTEEQMRGRREVTITIVPGPDSIGFTGTFDQTVGRIIRAVPDTIVNEMPRPESPFREVRLRDGDGIVSVIGYPSKEAMPSV